MSKRRRRLSGPLEIKNHRILEQAVSDLKTLLCDEGASRSMAVRASESAYVLWKMALRDLIDTGRCNARITHLALPEPPGIKHRIYKVGPTGHITGLFRGITANDHFGSNAIPDLSYVVRLGDGAFCHVSNVNLEALDKNGNPRPSN